MKSKHPRTAFHVPLSLGRTESDLTAKGQTKQLDLFREVLDRPAKIQVLSMMALSDPKRLDQVSSARIADIADAMGYERKEVGSAGKVAFDAKLYQRIEDVGLKLFRREVGMFVREPAGTHKDGRTKDGVRRKWRTGLVNFRVLQEFGFYYEDEDGQPIDLAALPKEAQDKLVKYEADGAADVKAPTWAIPAVDIKGNVILKEDGTPRRRPANGVSWRWSSRFAELSRDSGTSWRFWLDAVSILRKYLVKPVTFDLIWITLFHKNDGLIEYGFDSLVNHLGIAGKDKSRVRSAIDGAFQDMMTEGIIDGLPTFRDEGYYHPAGTSGRARRKGAVYQWRVAKRWITGPPVINVQAEQPATS